METTTSNTETPKPQDPTIRTEKLRLYTLSLNFGGKQFIRYFAHPEQMKNFSESHTVRSSLVEGMVEVPATLEGVAEFINLLNSQNDKFSLLTR